MVVDASVVVAAVMETRSRAAVAVAAASHLAAPALVDVEVTHVLRRKVLAGVLSARDGAQGLRRLQRLPLVRHPHGPFLDRMWSLRQNLTAYDAAYVALAERLGLPLLTLDRTLAQVPGLPCKVTLAA